MPGKKQPSIAATPKCNWLNSLFNCIKFRKFSANVMNAKFTLILNIKLCFLRNEENKKNKIKVIILQYLTKYALFLKLLF